ncbi:MAG: restriction endonuclease subunit S, partial [Streptococcaceae bacterium]|nr:restriction endonuclease subunit S [Streptococcaceae bacterium]
MPFEIPESWDWTRIFTVSYTIGTKFNQIKSTEIKTAGNYKVVSQGANLFDGFTNESEKVIDDLPLIMFGDHTRNVKYIDFPFVIGADGTKFHKALGIESLYLYYWMKWATNSMYNRGYARHYTLLKKVYIPLPPLAEQQRIINQIDFTLKKVSDYAKAYESLEKLNKQFPDKLRKSILQYAMQGKLVPQDPTDEPVEVLLEKIRAEKLKLYEAGKLKKNDLQETVIYKAEDNSY